MSTHCDATERTRRKTLRANRCSASECAVLGSLPPAPYTVRGSGERVCGHGAASMLTAAMAMHSTQRMRERRMRRARGINCGTGGRGDAES